MFIILPFNADVVVLYNLLSFKRHKVEFYVMLDSWFHQGFDVTDTGTIHSFRCSSFLSPSLYMWLSLALKMYPHFISPHGIIMLYPLIPFMMQIFILLS